MSAEQFIEQSFQFGDGFWQGALLALTFIVVPFALAYAVLSAASIVHLVLGFFRRRS